MDHDDIYEELESIIESDDETRLRITIEDDPREIEGLVTDAAYYGNNSIDITIDFFDSVEEDGVTAVVGHITQPQNKAPRLQLSAGDNQPVVGDVERVERIED